MKFWLIFLFNSFLVRASGQLNTGARLTALGNSSAAVKDLWGIQANPAGLTGLKRPVVSLNYTPNLLLETLATQAVAFVLPFEQDLFGCSIQRFGLDQYSDIHIGAAYAKIFGKLSVGLAGHFSQTKIEGYGSASGLSITSGLQYAWNKQLLIGFYIKNQVWRSYSNLPLSLSAGIAYQSNKKVLVACAISKISGLAISIQTGIDYEIINGFCIRAGISTIPFKEYAGFGIGFNHIILNTAISKDTDLGYSPQIEFGYAF